jgi:hypothetical protein
VEARDKKGNMVSAMPQWIVNPPAAGSINPQNGVFTPNANFIGRVNIVAQVNSRVRDEFVFNGEKGILIAYRVDTKGGQVSDYNIKGDQKIAEFTFAPSAGGVAVSLDKPNIQNSVERNVEQVGDFIMSDIFEIKTDDFFAVSSSDPVSLKLFVPQIYHKNLNGGQGDRNKLDVAIWDWDSLRWEYRARRGYVQNSPNFEIKDYSYNDSEKSLSLSVGEHINYFKSNSSSGGRMRIAIIARNLEADAEVVISPNPFSPFVSPRNDYQHITEMHGDVKGTCIKITPKSNETKFKPSAQVGIFTADGTPVYRATLNGLDAGQSYYLFWDGRTQLSHTAFNAVDILPNKAIFVKGNEMCRNGRYFVNVTIDDGKKKKRYTKEIILFK